MSHLIIVNGTMGVGKTTTCQYLKRMLDRSVFLDGDWCWDMHPFVVNEETKAMVMDNIHHLLQNFLNCSAYDYVIFCWVLNEQTVLDEMISALHYENVSCYSLVCDEVNLRKRIEKDIQDNIRTNDVLERSLQRRKIYEQLPTTKIDVSHIDAKQAAQCIYEGIKKQRKC